jgi:hypothetical protein
VVQRHPDLHTAVLEREHLRHTGQCGHLGGPVGERVDDRTDAARAERPERGVVVAGEADDLTPAEPGTTGTRSVTSVISSGSTRSLNDGNWFSNTTTS